MRTVVFDSHDDETDVTAFWQILSVDADALPSVASANRWLSNNQLHVNSDARFVENPMETVSLGRTLLVQMEEFCWRDSAV